MEGLTSTSEAIELNDELKSKLPSWGGRVPRLGLIPEDAINIADDPNDAFFRSWRIMVYPPAHVRNITRELSEAARTFLDSEDSPSDDETCLGDDISELSESHVDDVGTFPVDEFNDDEFDAQVEAFDAETEFLESADMDEDAARDFVLFRESQW